MGEKKKQLFKKLFSSIPPQSHILSNDCLLKVVNIV